MNLGYQCESLLSTDLQHYLIADPDAMSTRCEIAMLRNQLLEVLDQLGKDSNVGLQDQSLRNEMLQTIELIRKLVATEVKRIKSAEEYISVAEMLVLIAAVGDSVLRNVSDRRERGAIAGDFERLLKR